MNSAIALAPLLLTQWPDVLAQAALPGCPAESVCKANFEAAQRMACHARELKALGPGWQAMEQAETMELAAGRLEHFWLAAWWVAWPTATWQQREEWAEVIRAMTDENGHFR